MKYYYYRTYFADKPENDHKMHITANGVSIEYRDGRVLTTGLEPKALFPNQDRLTPKDINDLYRFIKYRNFQIGKLFDKETFDGVRNEYLKQKQK